MWVEHIDPTFRPGAPHTERTSVDGRDGEYFICENITPWLGVARKVRPKDNEGDYTMATASRVETGRLKGYFKTNRILGTYPTRSYASQYQLNNGTNTAPASD